LGCSKIEYVAEEQQVIMLKPIYYSGRNWAPAEAAKAASQFLPYSGIYWRYNVPPYFIHTA
jgi:hypothetical protein